MPEEIILDFFASDEPIHGGQEGRLFHGYCEHYCCLPLSIRGWPAIESEPSPSAPPPAAQVFVNGVETTQTDTDRILESPPLEAGKQYKYELKRAGSGGRDARGEEVGHRHAGRGGAGVFHYSVDHDCRGVNCHVDQVRKDWRRLMQTLV